jgi:hypothetical protein
MATFDYSLATYAHMTTAHGGFYDEAALNFIANNEEQEQTEAEREQGGWCTIM